MSKNQNKQKTPSGNQQDRIKNAVDSSATGNQNQGHNAKKEALGPNTNR